MNVEPDPFVRQLGRARVTVHRGVMQGDHLPVVIEYGTAGAPALGGRPVVGVPLADRERPHVVQRHLTSRSPVRWPIPYARGTAPLPSTGKRMRVCKATRWSLRSSGNSSTQALYSFLGERYSGSTPFVVVAARGVEPEPGASQARRIPQMPGPGRGDEPRISAYHAGQNSYQASLQRRNPRKWPSQVVRRAGRPLQEPELSIASPRPRRRAARSSTPIDRDERTRRVRPS
jgi:hypothetical protein